MTLDDCGDVLTIKQLCAVLQMSTREYYRLKSHGEFPIPPLPHLGSSVRYAKVAVQAYLAQQTTKLRRVG